PSGEVDQHARIDATMAARGPDDGEVPEIAPALDRRFVYFQQTGGLGACQAAVFECDSVHAHESIDSPKGDQLKGKRNRSFGRVNRFWAKNLAKNPKLQVRSRHLLVLRKIGPRLFATALF